MSVYPWAYLASAAAMLLLDALWLGVIAKQTYRDGIGHLMAAKPRLAVGAVFYAIYPLGLMIFAIVPGVEDPSWWWTVALAGAFGFFAYATYDLSNLATLRQWPLRITLLDMAWGVFASALSGAAGLAVMRWFAT